MVNLPALAPFRVSQAAIDQLEAVGGFVRVDITPGGCCGSTYEFSDGTPTPTDVLFGCEGAILAVTPDALAVLTGSRLDYGVGLRPPRYRVVANPNTPDRCPCNRSFGRVWPGRGQPGCRATEPMPWDGA